MEAAAKCLHYLLLRMNLYEKQNEYQPASKEDDDQPRANN